MNKTMSGSFADGRTTDWRASASGVAFVPMGEMRFDGVRASARASASVREGEVENGKRLSRDLSSQLCTHAHGGQGFMTCNIDFAPK